MNKDYKEFAVLASRLAESVLMDWDKEEQVRLAKKVATKCHSIFNEKEIREFVELVKRMRDAQAEHEIIFGRLMARGHKGVLTDKDFLDVASITDKVVDLEDEVDEYLKKMDI